MNAIRTKLRALGVDDRGATVIEYALIVALIALALIGALTGVGGGVGGGWSSLADDIVAAL